MLDSKVLEILKTEGTIAIAVKGDDMPHMVNTWHSYTSVNGDTLHIPVGGMKVFEELLNRDNRVIVTLATKGVGGFLIEGTGTIEDDFSKVDKAAYPWARAVLKIKVTKSLQTI